MKLYIIGSLRNPEIPKLASTLRRQGHEVFDDWYSAGPKADDCWQAHQQGKGLSFKQALEGPAATNVFNFDKTWLDWCDAAVLVLPAGKSGHLELGYVIGSGKPGYILLPDNVERWDVMYRFATKVFYTELGLSKHLFTFGKLDVQEKKMERDFAVS